MTWEPKPSSPASFNAVDALLSSVHGDPVYGWMEHFVHMYPNQYFNTAAFCAIGPSTIPPLVLTDFINLFPMGTDLVKASEGFDNLGQFVAAAHVANNNPNFTFEELAAKMHDGDGMSLGAAIHALDQQANAEAEVETAQTDAAADLKAAGKKK